MRKLALLPGISSLIIMLKNRYIQILVQILCFLDIIRRPFYFSKRNVSETRFCLSFQLKPTQLGPIDRAGHYLRTPVAATRSGIRAKHSTNHLRELRKH
jgi:hypothetical protein